jgi:hypothetical protein
MALSTRLKELANSALSASNLRVDTLTAARSESERISQLAHLGAFSKPIYPLVAGMTEFDPSELSSAYALHNAAIDRLKDPGGNTVGYQHVNDYFTTPDMEVLYLTIRTRRPARIVEVGSGNSTRIMRQAILDGGLDTELVAIDPNPRVEITEVADRFVRARAETLENYEEFDVLGANDILFIDSSHKAGVGNDVARLFCCVMPRLKPGVIVHTHDIFLPYEYPVEIAALPDIWIEQYLLHAFLQSGRAEVLWPGYYVQAARPDLHARLPFLPSLPETSRRDHAAVEARARQVLATHSDAARGAAMSACMRNVALSFWFRIV